MGNSSSTASSSTTTNDVFISFRGEDTRKGFTSHLYQALHDKQIKTFIDNQLKRGEEIPEGLWTAIGESKISVIIFSENYASSKWCLRELAEIMTRNQIVIPVFYQVDPSHVRKQSGSYEAAFAKHENESQQEVKKWREALTQASNISGFDSSKARDESEFVCNIVRDVWKKLYNIWPSCDFKELVKDLVGIEKPIERVVSLLCLGVPDFRIIGIWGMGGIGKTTIAEAVFHLVSHHFEKSYFAWRVREESEKDSTRLIRLRDKILSEVLNEKKLKISSPSIPELIKERLNQKKVLIVIDDVDKLEIFETLAKGLDRFGPGSRIILTSRDKQVLHECGVEDHNMYKVEGLNDDEALQLFCKRSFRQNHPTTDFDSLSREVVKIAKNLPLAVIVLGSSLYKKSKQDWKNAVDKFQRIVNPKIFDALRISYDGLDEEEKGLFLDYACFGEFVFKIDGEEYFAPNLSSDREFSLSGLIDKSLVTAEHGRIKMHDLLREMGREIVDKESPNKPGYRSRLWRQEDIFHMLKHNDGTEAVQGIFLSMFNLRDVQLGSQVFMKMYNLRTLIIKYGPPPVYGEVHLRIGDQNYLPYELRYPLEDTDTVQWKFLGMFNLNDVNLSFQALMKIYNRGTLIIKYGEVHLLNGGLDYLPDELRYLHWESYPLEVLPSSFNPVNLVELDLSHSKIKQLWEGNTCVPKLKRLNLFCCGNLIRIPDLSDIPSIESINLEGCISLLEIHSSRECQKLKQLDLEDCKNLIRIPDLSDIPSAETINLKFCSSLFEIHSSRECPKLKQLDLYGCQNLIRIPDLSDIPSAESIDLELCSSLLQIYSSRECPKNLHSLKLLQCENLSSLPSNIHIEGSEFCLFDCISLTKFPHILGNIKRLDLSLSGVEEVPSTIQNLSKLESLKMECCTRLKRISKSICKLKSLDRLDLWGCCKLESFPDILEGMELNYLDLSETTIKELPPSIENLNRLEQLVFSNCEYLERLPNSIKKLSKLCSLELNHCGMLRSLPELPSSLWHLEAINCKQLIQSLPDESEFELCADGSGLLYFNFINCLKMNQKAVSNLLIFFQDSILKMQLMGTEKFISLFEREEVEGSICLPGSEIPEWFSYKNIGSSINIPVLRNDCGRSRYIMGFAVCLVIGFDFDIGIFEWLDVRYDFHIETRDGHKEGFFHRFPMFDMPIGNDEFSYSDHIFLGYNLSPECYDMFQKLDTLLANRSMSDYVDTSFEFDCGWDHQQVKYCGIHPIYVQSQIMNSVAIDQDTGDTSGCNDTAEETCEPRSKRICTEANQCT